MQTKLFWSKVRIFYRQTYEIVEWLTYRIQDTDRATYLHLIESQKVSIVLCFVLEKILALVKQVVRSGPAFCSCSEISFTVSNHELLQQYNSNWPHLKYSNRNKEVKMRRRSKGFEMNGQSTCLLAWVTVWYSCGLPNKMKGMFSNSSAYL